MVKFFSGNQRWFFVLVLVFLVAELIVYPIGNFPLNDDWCYAKTVKILLEEGRVDVGESMASMLTHAYWGALFAKIFGFSFSVLRVSTLVSALIGLFFLNKLLLSVSGNKMVAFTGCLVLLFNPIYFTLTNSFMTDVNFVTLLIMMIYFAEKFFREPAILSFLIVFVLAVLLVMLRQFGIVAPFTFGLCCIFISKRRWLWFFSGIALAATVFLILRYYEAYLKTVLPPDAVYKFSGSYHITEKVFWENLYTNFVQRYTISMLHFLLYSFPFLIIFFPSIIKEFRFWALPALIVATVLTWYFFRNERFPIGNIFNNMSLGPETFVESLSPTLQRAHGHAWSETFGKICDFFKYFSISLVSACSILFMIRIVQLRFKPLLKNSFLIFMLALSLAYSLLLLLSDFYFDRYHLPLSVFGIIIFSFAARRYSFKPVLALPLLILMFYISVFGVRDYFELSRTKYQAYEFVKKDIGCHHSKINGGWEINGWHEGEKTVSWYFIYLYASYDYLIEFNPVGDFKEIGSYKFQRYFPYREDTLRLFIRSKPEGTQGLPDFLQKRIK